MRVLVDTTVWVDFFRGKDSAHVACFESFLRNREDICICGVILTEILQGIRDDKGYRRTKKMLGALTYLDMPREVFVQAANIYRHLRKRGITIRKPVDCMIGAVAIKNGIPLLHNDKDFRPIEKYCGLAVLAIQ